MRSRTVGGKTQGTASRPSGEEWTKDKADDENFYDWDFFIGKQPFDQLVSSQDLTPYGPLSHIWLSKNLGRLTSFYVVLLRLFIRVVLPPFSLAALAG